MRTRYGVSALILALLCIALSDPRGVVYAQSLPRLFEDGHPGKRPKDKPIKPHQARKAKLHLEALDGDALVLNLFDNAERTARKTKVDRPRDGRMVWHGVTDDGGLVTLAVVEGKASGTVYLDGRAFEITPDDDGEYTLEELNAAAFPADAEPMAPDQAPEIAGEAEASLSSLAADGVTEIDVMVVWTPAMRGAVGGTTAAAESLVLSAVANANTAYVNSGVNARLRLVYSGEVNFAEGNASSDLSALASTGDGRIDEVHALRTQYGADVVTLLGSGYVAAGTCGVGYLMQTVTTAFASTAFNVVDQSCAAGYLSYAHEVGHNQGLHHDPANAGGGAPSYPYAYGYQDPGNVFRTVMSYGSATRVPAFSSPSRTYNGRVTGTSSQDNARALSNNIATVASFRNTGGSQPPPPCSFSVSPTSLSFGSGTGTATVSVTTTAGCTWTSSSNSSWMSVSGSGTGSGSATVNVVANSGGSRNTTVIVAGVNVAVSQAAAPPPPPCTYSVSPTSLSFGSGSGSASVSVTTPSGCAWTSSSNGSWTTASGSGTGPGSVTVSVVANGGGSRNTTVVVAGVSVLVAQAAAPPPPPSCTYSVSPTSLSFASTGGTATVTVTTTSTCAWTSSSSQSWATVSGARTGSGTATVTVASTTGGARSATLTVAGKSVSVSQSAAPKGKGGGKPPGNRK